MNTSRHSREILKIKKCEVFFTKKFYTTWYDPNTQTCSRDTTRKFEMKMLTESGQRSREENVSRRCERQSMERNNNKIYVDM